MLYSALVAVSVLAVTFGADPGPPRIPAAPEGPARQILLPAGPPQPQYSPELQYNLLEPQFQYPGFNYYPEKQPYPRVQPPVVFYAGAAPPGQQFLYRPGAPPGNFLVPQPQPQPQPGPGVYFGGNPQGQGPVYVAGYPRPAHIPPIEKDAEEIPGLAGNHPVTRTPMLRPTARKPEKLETLDEPLIPTAGEADVLAAADKNPVFPKKSNPSRPVIPQLKPGQRFFILNGHPLFSNFPLEGGAVPQPNLPPTLHQSNPEIFLYRQPQYVSELNPQQYDQVPIQDLFLRNSVTGQIDDVKPAAISNAFIQPFTDGNFISLNQPNDFRENFVLKNVVPVAVAPQPTQQKLSNFDQKELSLTPVLLKAAKPESVKSEKVQHRLGKGIELAQQAPILQADPFAPIYVANPYSDVATFGNYYRYSELKDGKEEDDSVIIDAKVQNDHKESEEVTTTAKPEEPSLSQAQPAAIALAGTGGVASAGPRGTALAGVKGLAIARPQATAVAGPSKEEPETKTKPQKGRQ